MTTHRKQYSLWDALTVLGIVVIAALVALWTPAARADIVQVTWTNPTTYTNGVALPASAITRTRIEVGTNTATGTGCTFGNYIADVIANGAATAASTANLPVGNYAFRAYTTASGLESAASTPACKAIVQPPPNSPTGLSVNVTVNVTVSP
jgi:hypothetical protein